MKNFISQIKPDRNNNLNDLLHYSLIIMWLYSLTFAKMQYARVRFYYIYTNAYACRIHFKNYLFYIYYIHEDGFVYIYLWENLQSFF